MAASHAASLMNTFLEKLSFDDDALLAGTHTSETATNTDIPGVNPTGTFSIDGTELRWTLEVKDYLSNDPLLKFKHWRVNFYKIDGSPPAQDELAVDLPADGPGPYISEINGAAETNPRLIFDLDAKAGRKPDGVSPSTVMKELRLTIQWKSPRDAGFEDISGPLDKDQERQLRRTATLLTRRARLSREVTP